jgi:hypothetical protein
MSLGVECAKSDLVYVARVVDNLKTSAKDIANNPGKYPEISLGHSDYILSHYMKYRNEIEFSFPSFVNGFYPDGTNPYFIWKDSNARLAWEYLRKFYEYHHQWESLENNLSGWEEFLQTEPVNPVPSDIIDVFRNGSTLERYNALSYLRQVSWVKKLVWVGEREYIHPRESDVRNSERLFGEMFNIYDRYVPHYSERRHPIFFGNTEPAEILWTKERFQEPNIILDENGTRVLGDGIAIFLKKDENPIVQIELLLKKLPGYFGKKSDNRESQFRFRDDLHIIYLKILNNLPENHHLSSEMAKTIYPKSDRHSAFKRLEKAVKVAISMTEVYYLDLAYQPFRPSALRRYRQ